MPKYKFNLGQKIKVINEDNKYFLLEGSISKIKYNFETEVLSYDVYFYDIENNEGYLVDFEAEFLESELDYI